MSRGKLPKNIGRMAAMNHQILGNRHPVAPYVKTLEAGCSKGWIERLIYPVAIPVRMIRRIYHNRVELGITVYFFDGKAGYLSCFAF